MYSRLALGLLLLPMLSGCENTVAAYSIDGRDHAITLIREQSNPFASEVHQAFVAARFPECQRRYEILPGVAGAAKMELWQLRDRLFVAREGTTWYAIGTEKCEVQKMEPTGAQPPGRLIGTFEMRDGSLVFEKTQNAAAG